ncbi:MAG: DUF642 domain-containing protein [Phycisphaerae bacterium]
MSTKFSSVTSVPMYREKPQPTRPVGSSHSSNMERKESFIFSNRSAVLSRRCSFAAAALAAAGLTMLAVGTAQANMIKNGNFSANAAAYTTSPGYPNSPNPAAPTDWTVAYVSGTGINGPDTGFYATNGAPFAPSSTAGVRDFAFMSGPPTNYPQSFLSQTVATTAGQAYTLTYEAAGRTGDTPIGVLDVVIEDTTSNKRIATQTPTVTGAAFNTFTLSFTATSASTKVEFLKNQNPNNTVDVANVSMVPAVPAR